MTAVLGYRAYAKLNLYLEVLDERPDGYHNIETIFQTIDLGDDLYFTEHRSAVTLTCDSKEIDTGEENLAHRAATLLKRRFDRRQGVSIAIIKRIPVAAGLAGGSADAAATLVALNHLWDLGLDRARLCELALELGSDVPYCVVGGTVAATGRGEELEPLPPLSHAWFLLLHPPLAVSTSRIYHHPRLSRGPARPPNGRTDGLERALAGLERGDFTGAVHNGMESVVFYEHPQLKEWKSRLMEGGALAAAMSGSGPTLFGMFRAKRDAQKAAGAFPDVKTSLVRPVKVGVERIQ